MIITGISVGDTATYTCDEGYELIGSMNVTCTDSGTWSDEPPICRRKLKQYYLNLVMSLSILYSSMS